MKQFFIFFLFILSLFSCKPKEKKETVEEFIWIAHQGFILKDKENWIFDTTQLKIRQYFEYKKDQNVHILLGAIENNPKYFTLKSKDTVGLGNLLNKTLLNKKFEKKNYS